jgi:hypothetical protein
MYTPLDSDAEQAPLNRDVIELSLVAQRSNGDGLSRWLATTVKAQIVHQRRRNNINFWKLSLKVPVR